MSLETRTGERTRRGYRSVVRPLPWRLVVVALLVLVVGPLFLGQATARADVGDAGAATPPAAADSSTLTWSIRPAPTAAEPNRPNYSFDVEPGATIKDSIQVRNYGDAPLSLAIYASDMLATSTGALDLLPAGEKPVDVGAWIALEVDTIEVPAQKSVDVPFTMTVPADIEPGDHVGGIVTSLITPGSGADGQPVVLDRRLGARVQVRAAGELQPQIEISDLDVSYSGTVNPLGRGVLHVSYTATNTGNVRLGAGQRVAVSGPFGIGDRGVVLEPMPEVLPSNSVSFSYDVPGVWPTVLTTGEVTLTAQPTREGDVFPADVVTVVSARAWTIPWSQLVVLALLVGVPLWLRWRRRSRRRREEALVKQAVEEALASSSGAESSPAGAEI